MSRKIRVRINRGVPITECLVCRGTTVSNNQESLQVHYFPILSIPHFRLERKYHGQGVIGFRPKTDKNWEIGVFEKDLLRSKSRYGLTADRLFSRDWLFLVVFWPVASTPAAICLSFSSRGSGSLLILQWPLAQSPRQIRTRFTWLPCCSVTHPSAQRIETMSQGLKYQNNSPPLRANKSLSFLSPPVRFDDHWVAAAQKWKKQKSN